MATLLCIILLINISCGAIAEGDEGPSNDIPICNNAPTYNSAPNNLNNTAMADKFYCEYCGNEYSSVRTLTSCKCPKHPDGAGKGYHKLYEGSTKSKYTCKYCGNQYNTIRTMTNCKCPKHPQGAGKGWHSPAL